MADLDPDVVGRSGIDPVTGSILSQDVRNALMKRASINTSLVQNESLKIQRQRDQIDSENIVVAQNNQQALLGIGSNINSLKDEIGKLGTGLSGIALLLQKDSAEEENRIRSQQERDRKLIEQEVRIGKEGAVEDKIENAIVEPVQKLTPKVNDIFSRIGQAIGALFLGWLTNPIIEVLDNQQKDGIDKVKNIKMNILKNIGIAIGGLFAIKSGFGLIMKTIGTIGKFLGKLAIAPLLPLLPGIKPGNRTPGVGGGILKGITVISGLMNFFNKENVDGLLTLAAAFGPFKFVRMAAGAGYAADEIAEAFGGDIFKDNAIADSIVSSAKDLAKETMDRITSFISPTATNKSLEKTSTQTQSTTPIVGESTPTSTPPPTQVQPSTELTNKFQSAWDYRNNNLARGRIEEEWDKMTPEEKKIAVEWAKSKGYDWTEMRLNMPSNSTQSSPTVSAVPAQISTPIKSQQPVGSLPDPKPNLVMLTSSSNQPSDQYVPLTNGALTDVPLINSGNTDNFYVLYSQLNYNVVM